MEFDGNDEGQDFVDYADYAPEGEGTGLPDGHWAHDQEYLTWVNSFAEQLHSDEALLAKFNEWVTGLDSGEHGAAAEQAAHTPASVQASVADFKSLHDKRLAEVARNFLRPRES